MSIDRGAHPLMAVADVDPLESTPRNLTEDSGAPMIVIETIDHAGPVRPVADDNGDFPAGSPEVSIEHRRSGWLLWLVVAGVIGLALVGTIDWVLGLLARIPLLGAPAALATAALIAGVLGLVGSEARALRRLHDVDEVRRQWQQSDGEHLRRLIFRVGTELNRSGGAGIAAAVVDDAGPAAAKRIMSRDVLGEFDRRAATAVASAAKQGFVMVTASPSPALDGLLLMVRATRLLREIAVIYGYRPGALALRSLAKAAVRDVGAVAIADALAQAAAQSASKSMTKLGDAATVAGATATATGAGALVGIPLAVAGLGLSLIGRTVGATGGAIGGGAAAAWRLYRFGLMVLVAARPLPFDQAELAELKAGTRAELLKVVQRRDGNAPPG